MPKVTTALPVHLRRPIRVGFDLDGVLLYNPIRIYRPLIAFIKRRILQRKKTKFFVPQTRAQQWLFTQFHKTSFLIAPGFERIQELTEAGVIEPYLITARFAFLKPDLEKWLARMHAKQVFKACYYNEQNEQPHLFKSRKIAELQLDMFVEDNWDIVERINRIVRPNHPNFTCWWVSNLMDSGIPYPHKTLSLAAALDGISFGLTKTTTPKVLVATDFYYPHWTGLAQSFFHYIEAIKSHVAVQVQTIQFAPHLPATSQVNQIVVRRSPTWFGLSRAKISWRYLAEVWRSLAQTDSILVNSPSAHILPIALMSWLRGKRLVIFHNGDLLLPAGFVNRVIEKVFDLSTHLACQLAQAIATYTRDYSTHSRILAAHLGKFQAVGIPLRVASTIQAQPAPPPQTLAQQQVTQTLIHRIQQLKRTTKVTQLVGFAGRFVEEKGFDILFQAIPLVCQAHPQVKFVFAGEVAMGYEDFFAKNAALYRQVKPQVVLLGLLSGEALTAFYQQLDVFVLPSRSDCFALVQAEAALHGVPLVVADIPGARDLVKQTGQGALFISADPYDLAKQILAVLANPKQFRQPQAVATYFEYEKRARSFIQLLTN